MKKSKLITIGILIFLLSFAIIQTVVAQGLGIDLIALAQQKAASLAGISTANVSTQLEQTKEETVTDTLNFIDQYIKDLENSINQYAAQETETSKQQIKDKGQEVKDTLNSQKQQIIDGVKTQIKAKIQDEVNKKLDETDRELSIKIQEKFKN